MFSIHHCYDIILFIYILQIVGLTLIIVPVYSKISAVFTSWPIVGGAIACGVFMMLMSITGIYGAIKHHQIILFFVSFINSLDFCLVHMYHTVIIYYKINHLINPMTAITELQRSQQTYRYMDKYTHTIQSNLDYPDSLGLE